VENGAVNIVPFPVIVRSVATFMCSEIFHLVGDPARVCTADGWSRSNPSCSEFPVPMLTSFTSSGLHESAAK
jgi:hypothetical protein